MNDCIRWSVKEKGQKFPIIILQPVNERQVKEAKRLIRKLSKKAARLTGRF